MTCRVCSRTVTASDRFCQWCGAPSPATPDTEEPEAVIGDAEGAEPAAGSPNYADVEIAALRATVTSLAAELARLSLRLDALEGGRSAPPSRQGASQAAPPSDPPSVRGVLISPPAPEAAGQAALPVDAGQAASGQVASGQVGTGQVGTGQAVDSLGRRGRQQEMDRPSHAGDHDAGPGTERPRRPSIDLASQNWEWLVGGNWLARIGIVALILGVAFFISLAIDRGWLGEVERVALGVAGGLAFLSAGEYWRKRYAAWAQTVAGGGLAILYLSVYGAFALYELISPHAAFGAFSLITVAGAVLAVRQEAVSIAVIAILSGFATPMLLQERLPDQRLLLAYVFVLDVGVLALASFRNWRWFTLLALVGSLVLFGFWESELNPTAGLAQIGITSIFLIFVGATIAFNLVRRQAGRNFDLALITLNAAAYYGISYLLLSDAYRPYLGSFTVAVAAFYALLAIACRLRGEEQFNLSVFCAGLATVFAVIAVPVQLGGPWISVAWGLEGLVLVVVSFPLRMRELRWFGYVMFAVSAVWLLLWDTPDALSRDLTPFVNEYMLSYAAAVILPALAGWVLHLRRNELLPRERAAIPVFALRSAIFAAAAVPVQLEGIWIAISWALLSVVFLVLSGQLRMAELRWLGFGLLAATIVRLVAFDTFGVDSDTFRPVANWRFLAFTAGVAALYVAAWLEYRRGGDLPFHFNEMEEKAALPALLAMANLVTLWLLSAEIIAAADSALFGLSHSVSENVASLGLSLLWAVYAAILITLGVARRSRWIRLAGLALLAAPVIKLFAFDSLLLEQEFRVIAFLALGLLLVAGGLLYQRYSRVVRGFLFE